MDRSLFVGVDLGATNLRAIIGTAETTLARAEQKTPQEPNGDAITSAVLACVQTACDRAGISPTAVAAAGISSIGPLDRDAGIAVDPPNVDAERIELIDPLASLLDTERVVLHNDADAGVIGERELADAPENTVYLTFSTGIGAGVSVDGHVLTGHRGNAAEVGHFVVDPDGRLTCGCGSPGHWEAYCSGSGIPRLLALLAEKTEFETALPVEGSGKTSSEAFDAADVFARPDDPLASRTIEEITQLNALGVAATIHAFAPAEIRVGGAVALNNSETIITPLREHTAPYLVTDEPPAIERTHLGADAPLLGALASARIRHSTRAPDA